MIRAVGIIKRLSIISALKRNRSIIETFLNKRLESRKNKLTSRNETKIRAAPIATAIFKIRKETNAQKKEIIGILCN
jgi:hypothetical protein